MWSRNLIYRFYVLLVFLCALGAIVYAPQRAHGQTPRFPDGAIHIMIPQFVAEAVNFKANDESGYDWPGSDEVYAVFSDLNPNLSDLVTSEESNVDTGETRTFGTTERCIAPRPRCDHGVSDILHFEVSFWERDELPTEYCHGDAPGLHQFLRHGICSFDDLIGSEQVLMSREQLLVALPRVGDSLERKLILGGLCGPVPPGGENVGCGFPGPTGPEYELTFLITRLPDVEMPIVIAPPR
jgi:hypothetical protein